MNDWMVPKLTWDDSYRPDRGKVLTAEQLDQVKTFHRYLDVDGDGVPYRTLPGVHPQGCVLHARVGTQPLRRLHRGRRRVRRRARSDRSQDSARGARACPRPSSARRPGAKLGLLTIGGCHAACIEALDLFAQDGIALDYMRVRGFPFGDDVAAFLESPRAELHRRAEPRRAAAQPADARDRRRRSTSWSRCATTAGSR